MVLLPKDNAGTRSIELLEVLWKVAEAIIDTWIKTTVMFNDVLHGFRTCRGTGTDIMELNMAQ